MNKFETLLMQYTQSKSYITAEESKILSDLFENKLAYNNALLAWVKGYAIAPISDFAVAALAVETEASGGRIFFGSNLEFPTQALSLVVHGEQSAIHNAYVHGADSLQELIINAKPCGFCRQFINEIKQNKQPKISVNGITKTLDDYLPAAFGPNDLHNDNPLFSMKVNQSLVLEDYYAISYAPYSHNKAACELSDVSGRTYFGVYIENAAYSPSLSPLQAALSQMQLHNRGKDFNSVTKVRILQTQGCENQQGAMEAVMSSLNTLPEIIYEQA